MPEIANKYTETHENTDTRNHRHSVAHKHTFHTDKQIKLKTKKKQKQTRRIQMEIEKEGRDKFYVTYNHREITRKRTRKEKEPMAKLGFLRRFGLRSRNEGMNIFANEEGGRI